MTQPQVSTSPSVIIGSPSPHPDPAHTHTHLLYVLLDSNLPTGGFVASSGLESFAKHGFLRSPALHSHTTPYTLFQHPNPRPRSNLPPAAGPSSAPALGPSAMARSLMSFADAEITNYHATTGWYLDHSWRLVNATVYPPSPSSSSLSHPPPLSIDETVTRIVALDNQHESTLLSHVARRASRAQGIALLTLHARGFSRPPGFETGATESEALATAIVNEYKRLIRKGTCPGHLAVCWGVMTGALGLDLDTARHLYLFTHARSLLSAAVRLNLIGPYLSTQLLSHPMREIIDRLCALSSSKIDAAEWPIPSPKAIDSEWDWADEAETGPATTWPLGEILAARHDMQHSRIFNS